MLVTPAQRLRGHRGVWQARYWEHTIRDERDYEAHRDYIHYNPVKHGYVSDPSDWPWSSIGRFVRGGDYEPGWGRIEPASLAKLTREWE